jgi:hypothetical protein
MGFFQVDPSIWATIIAERAQNLPLNDLTLVVYKTGYLLVGMHVGL